MSNFAHSMSRYTHCILLLFALAELDSVVVAQTRTDLEKLTRFLVADSSPETLRYFLSEVALGDFEDNLSSCSETARLTNQIDSSSSLRMQILEESFVDDSSLNLGIEPRLRQLADLVRALSSQTHKESRFSSDEITQILNRIRELRQDSERTFSDYLDEFQSAKNQLESHASKLKLCVDFVGSYYARLVAACAGRREVSVLHQFGAPILFNCKDALYARSASSYASISGDSVQFPVLEEIAGNLKADSHRSARNLERFISTEVPSIIPTYGESDAPPALKTREELSRQGYSAVSRALNTLETIVKQAENQIIGRYPSPLFRGGLANFQAMSDIADYSSTEEMKSHFEGYFHCILNGPTSGRLAGQSYQSGVDWLKNKLSEIYGEAVNHPSNSILVGFQSMLNREQLLRSDSSRIPIVQDVAAQKYFDEAHAALVQLLDQRVYAFRRNGGQKWIAICDDSSHLAYLQDCVCDNKCALGFYDGEIIGKMLVAGLKRRLQNLASEDQIRNWNEAIFDKTQRIQELVDEYAKIFPTAEIDAIFESKSIMPLSASLALVRQQIDLELTHQSQLVSALNKSRAEIKGVAESHWREIGLFGRGSYFAISKPRENLVYSYYSLRGLLQYGELDFGEAEASRRWTNRFVAFEDAEIQLSATARQFQSGFSRIDGLRSQLIEPALSTLAKSGAIASQDELSFKAHDGSHKLLSVESMLSEVDELDDIWSRIDLEFLGASNELVAIRRQMEQDRAILRSIVIAAAGFGTGAIAAGGSFIGAVTTGLSLDMGILAGSYAIDWASGRPLSAILDEAGMEIPITLLTGPAAASMGFATSKIVAMRWMSRIGMQRPAMRIGFELASSSVVDVGSFVLETQNPLCSKEDRPELNAANLATSLVMGLGFSAVPTALNAMSMRGVAKRAHILDSEVALLRSDLEAKNGQHGFEFDIGGLPEEPSSYSRESLQLLVNQYQTAQSKRLVHEGTPAQKTQADISAEKIMAALSGSSGAIRVKQALPATEVNSARASLDEDARLMRRSLDKQKEEKLAKFRETFEGKGDSATYPTNWPRESMIEAVGSALQSDTPLAQHARRLGLNPSEVSAQEVVDLILEQARILDSPTDAMKVLLDVWSDIKMFQFQANRGKSPGQNGYLSFVEAEVRWYLLQSKQAGMSGKLAVYHPRHLVGFDNFNARSASPVLDLNFEPLSPFMQLSIRLSQSPEGIQELTGILRGQREIAGHGGLLQLLDQHPDLIGKLSPDDIPDFRENYGKSYDKLLSQIRLEGHEPTSAEVFAAIRTVEYAMQNPDQARINHLQRHIQQEAIVQHHLLSKLPREKWPLISLSTVALSDRHVRNGINWAGSGISGINGSGGGVLVSHLRKFHADRGGERFGESTTLVSRINGRLSAYPSPDGFFRDPFVEPFVPAGVSSDLETFRRSRLPFSEFEQMYPQSAQTLKEAGYESSPSGQDLTLTPERLEEYREKMSSIMQRFEQSGDQLKLFEELRSAALLDGDLLVKRPDSGEEIAYNSLSEADLKSFVDGTLSPIKMNLWMLIRDGAFNASGNGNIVYSFAIPEIQTHMMEGLLTEMTSEGIDRLRLQDMLALLPMADDADRIRTRATDGTIVATSSQQTLAAHYLEKKVRTLGLEGLSSEERALALKLARIFPELDVAISIAEGAQ